MAASSLGHLGDSSNPGRHQMSDINDNLENTFHDALDEPSRPLRQIPRPYQDVSLSDEDVNYSDNIGVTPAQNADLPPQSRI
ncbi:hypothetical protein EV702DRAFT_1201568 [Suillus placidus]|uniref:Uncharacterized protein n=1 Tax=Suillus placidus TaxID=48579 RepID=A0A9P6ZP45_9AGAM|nr:hypothetical protein EV702DRAFT_1201568 [Suillus placidus]